MVMNNNKESKLFVGSQIPFIKESQTTPTGSLSQSFEYKDAGTTLKITPNINQGDNVSLKIELESSQAQPGQIVLGGQVIVSRTFSTELAVQSGETILIGGIMRESDSNAIRGIPILGQIPVVNIPFRKKDKSHETTELIAFITPTVLRTQMATRHATQRAAEQMGLGLEPREEANQEMRRDVPSDGQSPTPDAKAPGDSVEKSPDPAADANEPKRGTTATPMGTTEKAPKPKKSFAAPKTKAKENPPKPPKNN
jgi:general secretion pathway protein D